MFQNSELKKRKNTEIEVVTELKKQLVFFESGIELKPLDNKVIHKHLLEALLSQKCSIIDIYLSILTDGDLKKFKEKLESHQDLDDAAEIKLIQLNDLISESTQHLGFMKLKMGFMVNSEPNYEHLKQQLRWHDVAIWQMVYNLYGNQFNAMPDREKHIYATIMKSCFDTNKERALMLIGLLYQK